MPNLNVRLYTPSEKQKWDKFVLKESVNGTVLQSKRFLDYHRERFHDCSLILEKGTTMVGVVPACLIEQDGKRIFSSHKGSTFGGIVIGKPFYNIENVEAIMDALEAYFVEQNYDEVWIKCTSDIFAYENSNLLQYYLFQRGFFSFDEMSCYVDFQEYKEEIITNFSSGRRRDYNYSLKAGLTFRRICSDAEIKEFYDILCANLVKHHAKPVHSYEELLWFRVEILSEEAEFYGVFQEQQMIAGSMVFNFNNLTLHTQYLAADQTMLKCYPMNYLNASLITLARERGFRYMSFGTSNEDNGKVLNKSLAQFKEGFGTKYGLNRTFIKRYS